MVVISNREKQEIPEKIKRMIEKLLLTLKQNTEALNIILIQNRILIERLEMGERSLNNKQGEIENKRQKMLLRETQGGEINTENRYIQPTWTDDRFGKWIERPDWAVNKPCSGNSRLEIVEERRGRNKDSRTEEKRKQQRGNNERKRESRMREYKNYMDKFYFKENKLDSRSDNLRENLGSINLNGRKQSSEESDIVISKDEASDKNVVGIRENINEVRKQQRKQRERKSELKEMNTTIIELVEELKYRSNVEKEETQRSKENIRENYGKIWFW
jgi:hypothetical protein